MQMRKEGAHREILPPKKNPIASSKCRFLSKFPKAHSCNSMLMSINGPCLYCFRKYLHMKRCSQASQVLSLSSTFSLPEFPTAPDGLGFSSLSFSEGVGETKELEKKQGPENLPVCALALTKSIQQGWSQTHHRLVSS